MVNFPGWKRFNVYILHLAVYFNFHNTEKFIRIQLINNSKIILCSTGLSRLCCDTWSGNVLVSVLLVPHVSEQ